MEWKDLEQLKNELFENARKEGKSRKLSEIARHLGENIRHNWGPKYGFTDGDIRIYVDDYGNYMTVNDGKRLVCSTHNERVYIPAVCDEIIAKHFPAAEEIKARKDDERRKQKEAALHRELFG